MTAEPEKPGGAPIRIRYVESADYFVEATEQLPAVSVSVSATRTSRWQNVLLILIVPLIPVLMFLQMRIEHRSFEWRPLVVGLVLIGILIGVGILLFFLLRKRGLPFSRNYYRKSYRKQVGRDESNVVAEFGQEAFFISSEDGVATHIPWHTIPRAVQRPKGLFLYESDTVFRWIPKSAFASDADYAAAIDLLQAKIAKFEKAI
jgi:hypothetical protein